MTASVRVIVMLLTFINCAEVPSQINWVLSAFNLRRFDDIHLFMPSIHADTIGSWAEHRLASVCR